MSDGLLTFSKYASHRGCTAAAVSQAVREKRLDKSVVERDGRRWIDPQIADREWAENSRRIRQPQIVGDSKDAKQLLAARAKREGHEARLAELRERQTAGELVEKRAVELAASRIGRMTRDTFLGLPSRVAPDLAAISDPWELEQRLEAAIRQVLDDLARTTAQDLQKAVGGE
jgi:phage terminase Nu1 subunit (DNA packaging protein)